MGQLLKFSLEDHLTECEERYAKVVDRLDSIDDRLYRLELLILSLKDSLKN